MLDWNVVATAHEDGFAAACRMLQRHGELSHTDYFNVVVLKVPDSDTFLTEFGRQVEEEPGILNFVSRVVPAQFAVNFSDPKMFETVTRELALHWVPDLAHRSFHVRMHRRGFKGRLSSPAEERFLDEALLSALEAAGTPGRISFEDPDAIISVETVSNRCGLSFWTREDLLHYPFIGVD